MSCHGTDGTEETKNPARPAASTIETTARAARSGMSIRISRRSLELEAREQADLPEAAAGGSRQNEEASRTRPEAAERPMRRRWVSWVPIQAIRRRLAASAP